ncbi:MAG: carbohydrate ABC transporter permease, partial [Planctomycetota bacterium]
MPSESKHRRFNVLVHFVLVPVALLTLVPFIYLLCSSVKPTDVFFTGQFLPRVGLFEVDGATGGLSMSDPTHLADTDRGTFPVELRANLFESSPGELDPVTKPEAYAAAVAEAEAQATSEEQLADLLAEVERRAAPVRTLVGTESFNVLVRYGKDAGQPVENAADFDHVFDVQDGERDFGGTDNVVDLPHPAVSHSFGTVIPTGHPSPKDLDGFEIVDGNRFGFLGVAWGLLSFGNFGRLFGGEIDFGRAVVNSFFLASVTSIVSTLGAAMGGYALAKHQFRGQKIFLGVVLAALVIPGALLLAPAYQLLYWLGLLDSYAGLILPAAAPAFGVFLFRQAMLNGVPDEMLQAARIDGCGEVRMFFEMALPMARPMIGAFLLITFLGTWNNFIGPQIVLSSPEKFPLSVAINQLRGVYGTEYGLIMAGTLVSILP